MLSEILLKVRYLGPSGVLQYTKVARVCGMNAPVQTKTFPLESSPRPLFQEMSSKQPPTIS